MRTDKEHLDQLPLFFILGRPRSGTTLLSTLIDAHPNAMVPFECSLIINLYRKYINRTIWTKKHLNEFYQDLLTQRKFDIWPIDRNKLKENILKCEGPCTFQQLIKLVYLHFGSFFEKNEIKILGDKNPIYSFYSRQLLNIFPEAKIIHLTRDYRDNMVSMKKVNFEASFTALLAHRWTLANKQLLSLKKKYPQQYHFLRYEDLVTEPEKQMKMVFDFLGIPENKEVLAFHNKKEEVLKSFSKEEIDHYHSSLYKPINQEKINVWEKTLKVKDIRIADHIAGKLAQKLGYSPEYDRSTFGFIHSFPWIIYSDISILMRKIVDHMPFALKNRIRNKGPVMAFIVNRMVKK